MRLAGPLLFVAAMAAARAAEPAAAPQDSISAAKSDLATIKAPQAQSDLSQALPGLDMKDVGSVPGATLPTLSSLLNPDDQLGPNGLKKKKEGTGNWLIDAMDKTDPERAKSKDKGDLLKTDSDAVRGDEHASNRTENEFVLMDQSREKTHESEPAKAPVFNPLDSFMAGWISAKDQEVLLPVSKGEIAGTDAPKAKVDSLQNLDLGPSGPASDTLSPGLDGLPPPDLKAGPNPYLAEIDTVQVAQVKGFTAPELPAIGAEPMEVLRGPSAPEIDARPADVSHAFVPDFAQPDGDDKYFKQMKRF
ncbi:MAG TPA: hypothetical protein VFE25_15215 [Opitutaceae bacterium]|jgi:hypothetical protein|nr:hypothetical protein [Opitutaceae bacterium]